MSARSVSRPRSAIVRMALEQGVPIEAALAPLRASLSVRACEMLPDMARTVAGSGTCAWVAPGELSHAASPLPSGATAIEARELALLGPMLALQGSGSMVREADVAPAIAAVRSARSVAETAHATEELMLAVERSHRSLFTAGLADACAASARSIDFENVTVSTLSEGQLEITAEDRLGRALVTSIHLDSAGPVIETELVGGSNDVECLRIVGSFNEALTRNGVSFTATSKPESTDGRIATEAARAFLRRKPGRSDAAAAARKRTIQAARTLRGRQSGGRS